MSFYLYILSSSTRIEYLVSCILERMPTLTKNKLLLATYIMTILYALHYGMPLYATSSFLNMHFSSPYVSTLFMLGSVLTLFASLRFTKYLRRFHTYRFVLTVVISDILATLALILTTNPYLLGIAFLLHFCFQSLILICLNVFIETFTNHAQAGAVRGIFLTLLNFGILIAPFFGGAILSMTHSFTILYTVAAFTLVPFIFFLRRFMYHAPDPVYHSIDILRALSHAWGNKNLRGAFVAVFLLECFYAFMVIYFPIYIVNIGVPLLTYLTAIVPISLIPLVVLPYELGIIADKKLGEKELLIFGLLVTAASVLTMAVLTTTVTIIWIIVLVISRVGAASIETMVYTYFYKKIGPDDVSLTAAFTNMRSTATIVMTAVSILLAPLLITHPQLIFILLALALLYGVTYILPIRDTR